MSICINNFIVAYFLGSLFGKVRSVAVAGCETSNPCILRSGQSAALTVEFTTCKCQLAISYAIHHNLLEIIPAYFIFSGRYCQG